MMRRFNTAGPCRPDWHYMIPASRRLPEAPALVEQMAYFVVHAPRQTGKTTALRALADELMASGRYAALVTSCEAGQAVGEDYEAAQREVLTELRVRAQTSLPSEMHPPTVAEGEGGLLRVALSDWARVCPRPIVLFLDEIDALRGESLIAVLRQLRAGFPDRPTHFPASVVLCGLRDVRDYKAASGGDPERLGTSSPFNIKLASLRLGDFSEDEVRELYAQHTTDTGQAFTEGALSRAFAVTRGQPWLVNALAREIIEAMRVPASEPITEAHVEEAKERLILARATHLDSLVARLHEPRVRRFIEPILAGTTLRRDAAYDDDLLYCRDLGLLAANDPIRVANPIYREVIARVLAGQFQGEIFAEPRSFVLRDGRLSLPRILREFASFWSEHGEILAAGAPYHEVAPQLVLMAYLQRVVNGGGIIDREYGVGRGRIDLLVRWPYTKKDGTRALQRRALELKVWREGEPDPLAKGLVQLDGYLGQLRLRRGTLVIFDRRAQKARKKRRAPALSEVVSPKGRRVALLRV